MIIDFTWFSIAHLWCLKGPEIPITKDFDRNYYLSSVCLLKYNKSIVPLRNIDPLENLTCKI